MRVKRLWAGTSPIPDPDLAAFFFASGLNFCDDMGRANRPQGQLRPCARRRRNGRELKSKRRQREIEELPEDEWPRAMKDDG